MKRLPGRMAKQEDSLLYMREYIEEFSEKIPRNYKQFPLWAGEAGFDKNHMSLYTFLSGLNTCYF